MNDILSPELISRDQAFEEVERVSSLAASYARSAGEAAYRGDQVTVKVSLQQLRLCTIHMIHMFRDFIDGP